MADILSIISLVSFILSGVFLIAAIVLLVVFKIPSVIGDLSGRNAKKSIEKLRKNNEKTGKKSYSSSSVSISRGKLTEAIKDKDDTENISTNGETGLLRENFKGKYNKKGTEILEDATEVLEENSTTVLNESAEYNTSRVSKIVFEYIEDIMLVHTEEVI